MLLATKPCNEKIILLRSLLDTAPESVQHECALPHTIMGIGKHPASERRDA
jgi:hypothetical protein